MDSNIWISNSEEETFSLGRTFAKEIAVGNNIAFYGDLGSGKTLFIQGLCSFFSTLQNATSPTFNILNVYEGYKDGNEINIYHIDLYRISDKAEALDIGFYEWLYDDSAIKLIEWADRIEDLDNIDYKIIINYNLYDDNFREIEIVRSIKIDK